MEQQSATETAKSGIDAAMALWDQAETNGTAEESEETEEKSSDETDVEVEASAEESDAEGDAAEGEDEGKPKLAAKPKEKEEEIPVDKLAILAKKERALRQKEEQLVAKVREAEKAKSEIEAKYQEQEALIDEVKRELKGATRNFPAFLTNVLGIPQENFAHFANELIAVVMGNDAPQDLRMRNEGNRLKWEMDALRRENEDFKRKYEEDRKTREEAAQLDSYKRQIKAQLKELPEEMKYLRAFVKKDIDDVQEALIALARTTYQKDGVILSPLELADSYEAALREEWESNSEVYSELLSTNKGAPDSKRKVNGVNSKAAGARSVPDKRKQPQSVADRIRAAQALWENSDDDQGE